MINNIGNIDYMSGPYIITITAGLTSVLFNVTINDDNIHEGIEEFNLIIATTQDLPDRIYFGENLTATITIEDNDGMSVLSTMKLLLHVY